MCLYLNMNKQTIIYLLLLSVIIISLGIGMYAIEGYENSLTKFADVKKNADGIVDAKDERPKYNKDNLYVTYHDSIENIIKLNNSPELDTGTAYVMDKSGNKVALPPIGGNGVSPVYYTPGSYKFGASTYVPNYEDSVYLSKTTGESSSTPIQPAAVAQGFCKAYEKMPEKLEEECIKTSANSCASTSCCILLGGAKCVSGNEQGPSKKEHYGDTTVLNRDYYFYKAKCYGNCTGSAFSYSPQQTSYTNGLTTVYPNKITPTEKKNEN